MTALLSLGLILAPVSLDQAIEQGLANHPQLTVATAKIEGAAAQARGARANYGAKLIVEGSAMLWHEEQKLSLGAGGGGAPQLPPPATPYEAATAGLLQGLASMGDMTVREHLTTSVKVQVVQPLMDLYKVGLAEDAANAGVEAQKVERAVARRAVTRAVVEVYLRTLQAKALQGATEASLANIVAQRGRVQALHEAGLLDQTDVLRLEVAEADARQKVNAAKRRVDEARLGLGVAMGVEGAVDVADGALPSWIEGDAPQQAAAVEAALSQRPELRLVDHRRDQAGQGVKIAKADYLPSVNLIGQYEHTTGSELQPTNALFGGLALRWTAFEWGATDAKIQSAQAQARQIDAAEAELRQRLVFEAEKAWRAVRSATDIVGVAETAVKQAEEAFRLERARHEAQRATTTELLAAETALTNARINLTTARFERLVALNTLRYASGQPLRGAL